MQTKVPVTCFETSGSETGTALAATREALAEGAITLACGVGVSATRGNRSRTTAAAKKYDDGRGRAGPGRKATFWSLDLSRAGA
jgi:hypothetical protein